MIRTIIHISWLRLWHNKAELALTFVVPVLFFSIFAWIFGSRGTGSTPKLKIAVCDLAKTDLSHRTIQMLEESQSIALHPNNHRPNQDSKYPSIARPLAEAFVQRGLVNAAIVFQPAQEGSADKIEILTDSYDQVASQVVLALVQRTSMAANLASSQPHAPNGFPSGSTSSPSMVAPASATADLLPTNYASRPIPVELVDVLGVKKSNPVIAMYAAGIAVMFVLFSATTASGSLLEEKENSTLERLLSSGLTIDQLLLGKWCYLTIIGAVQITLMFGFAALVFRLELNRHLDGFVAMTLVTSGAAACFALMLATACRTRGQLGWISTMVILTMSALGGSMVPRYLMSENIRQAGQWTFNAWALDGYNKVFWRELPLVELKNELAVLVASGLLFLVIARLLATRWDRQ
jgi:ABC-2 type transport system permease protein